MYILSHYLFKNNFTPVLIRIIAIASFIIVGLQIAVKAQDPLYLPVSVTSTSFMEEFERCYYSQLTGVESEFICNTELYGSIEGWLGTPYRYSGTTRSGVDCSAFVRAIYRDTYDHSFNGNSTAFYRASSPVKQENLKEGDLVFFRINRNKTISHVGVFLGNDKFAHASRSRGVVISDLNSPYYKRHFVRGGRMILTTGE
jgi:lipoprotein Spr